MVEYMSRHPTVRHDVFGVVGVAGPRHHSGTGREDLKLAPVTRHGSLTRHPMRSPAIWIRDAWPFVIAFLG